MEQEQTDGGMDHLTVALEKTNICKGRRRRPPSFVATRDDEITSTTFALVEAIVEHVETPETISMQSSPKMMGALPGMGGGGFKLPELGAVKLKPRTPKGTSEKEESPSPVSGVAGLKSTGRKFEKVEEEKPLIQPTAVVLKKRPPPGEKSVQPMIVPGTVDFRAGLRKTKNSVVTTAEKTDTPVNTPSSTPTNPQNIPSEPSTHVVIKPIESNDSTTTKDAADSSVKSEDCEVKKSTDKPVTLIDSEESVKKPSEVSSESITTSDISEKNSEIQPHVTNGDSNNSPKDTKVAFSAPKGGFKHFKGKFGDQHGPDDSLKKISGGVSRHDSLIMVEDLKSVKNKLQFFQERESNFVAQPQPIFKRKSAK